MDTPGTKTCPSGPSFGPGTTRKLFDTFFTLPIDSGALKNP